MEILTRAQKVPPIEELEPVVSLEELRELQLHVREVYVEDMIKEYIVFLANQTREHPSVYLGASPSASIALMKASQAIAILLEEIL